MPTSSTASARTTRSTRPRSLTSRARVRVRAASQLLDRQSASPRRRCAHRDTYFEEARRRRRGSERPVLGGSSDLAYYHLDPKDGAPTAIAQPLVARHPVNEGGSLSVLAGLIRGRGAERQGRASFSVRHHRSRTTTQQRVCSKWPGLGRTRRQLRRPDGQVGRQALAGSSTATSSSSRPASAARPIAMIEQRKSDAGNATVASLGGRVSYAFTPFQVVGELGVDRIKPDAAPARTLRADDRTDAVQAGGVLVAAGLRMFLTTRGGTAWPMRLRARRPDGPGRRQDPRDQRRLASSRPGGEVLAGVAGAIRRTRPAAQRAPARKRHRAIGLRGKRRETVSMKTSARSLATVRDRPASRRNSAASWAGR